MAVDSQGVSLLISLLFALSIRKSSQRAALFKEIIGFLSEALYTLKIIGNVENLLSAWIILLMLMVSNTKTMQF